MFYEPETDKTYNSLLEFRLEYRNTSFGELDTEEERNRAGLYSVANNPPNYDILLEDCTQVGITLVAQVYTIQYTITPKVIPVIRKFNIITSRCSEALSAHLDSVAKTRLYDNRVTCALRAGYPGPFQAEGIAFATWMDTCNALSYQFLQEVKDGLRPLPDNPQQLIDALPEMVWPT